MNETTPQKALQDVIALGELATPGEWRYVVTDDGTHCQAQNVWGPSVTIRSSGNIEHNEPDMLFIAEATNFIRQHGQHFAWIDENYHQRDADAVEYEFQVWQDDTVQAVGGASTLAETIAEANHYAMMYGQDGPVVVRYYERRDITAAIAQAEREGCPSED